jgi:Subtilase family
MLMFRRVVSVAAAGAVSLAPLLGVPAATAATGMPPRPVQPGPGATAQLTQDMLNAWKVTQGSGVTVAVLSSGVDPDAPGLQGKVTAGHDYVSFPYPAPIDGTIIAEAIAGSGPASSDPFGAVGRAPQAKILSIRVYPDGTIPGANAYLSGENAPDISASAITEAVNSGAKVIFDSLVSEDSSASLERAVAYATSKNVVVVGDEFSFSNSDLAQDVSAAANANRLLYPAAEPGVLGAGCVFVPGVPAPSPQAVSPANQTILVGAPGNDILAYGPDGSGYEVQNSWAAAAWLTGTAALIKSVYPNLAPVLVARAIALSARDHPPGGYDTTTGFGLINPAGALQQAAVLSKLTETATPGQGVASPAVRFVSGPAPGAISAVRHSAVKVAGFGAAIVAGLICLILAMVLMLRRRPAAAVPPGSDSLT